MEEEKEYKGIKGLMYKVSEENNGIIITSYDGTSPEIQVPEIIDELPVIGTGFATFCEKNSLESVILPKNMKFLAPWAFIDCKGLTSVTFGKNLESIGYASFAQCIKIESVVIPKKITTIDMEMFMNCSSLSSISIPDGVTTIIKSAFDGCTALTSIDIPDSIQWIDEMAFTGCKALTNVSYRGEKYSYNAATDTVQEEFFFAIKWYNAHL